MVDYFALATGITRQHAAAIREIPVTDRLASIVVHLAEAHRQLGILYGEGDAFTFRVYAAWSDAEARLTQAEKEPPCQP
jgi:hypothetical protein